MYQPWKCPDCATWIAPGVTQHRCDDPPATAVPATPIGGQAIPTWIGQNPNVTWTWYCSVPVTATSGYITIADNSGNAG